MKAPEQDGNGEAKAAGTGNEPPKRNYRMRMGNDYRFHFEDPELRKKAGDGYEFCGNEPGTPSTVLHVIRSDRPDRFWKIPY